MPPDRQGLLDELADHAPRPGPEASHLARIQAFVLGHEEPWDRELLPGHVVASGLVASPELDRIVLLHHRTLDLWLQCGGHLEAGDATARSGALREASEETGLSELAPHQAHPGLLDVDVHEIPATREMPAHQHLDLRYLLVADPDRRLDAPESEVKEIGWFTLDAATKLGLDEGLQRLIDKVASLP